MATLPPPTKRPSGRAGGSPIDRISYPRSLRAWRRRSPGRDAREDSASPGHPASPASRGPGLPSTAPALPDAVLLRLPCPSKPRYPCKECRRRSPLPEGSRCRRYCLGRASTIPRSADISAAPPAAARSSSSPPRTSTSAPCLTPRRRRTSRSSPQRCHVFPGS